VSVPSECFTPVPPPTGVGGRRHRAETGISNPKCSRWRKTLRFLWRNSAAIRFSILFRSYPSTGSGRRSTGAYPATGGGFMPGCTRAARLDFSQNDGTIPLLWSSQCEPPSTTMITSPCHPTGEAKFGVPELIPARFALPSQPCEGFLFVRSVRWTNIPTSVSHCSARAAWPRRGATGSLPGDDGDSRGGKVRC
jgi:hypothetical protein